MIEECTLAPKGYFIIITAILRNFAKVMLVGLADGEPSNNVLSYFN